MGYYSFNWPWRDGRLSWPCWLTGWHFTHKVVTRPAISLAQDRESSPARTRSLTTMLRHQLVVTVASGAYTRFRMQVWPLVGGNRKVTGNLTAIWECLKIDQKSGNVRVVSGKNCTVSEITAVVVNFTFVEATSAATTSYRCYQCSSIIVWMVHFLWCIALLYFYSSHAAFLM